MTSEYRKENEANEERMKKWLRKTEGRDSGWSIVEEEMSRRDLEPPSSPRCSGILVLAASGIWIANGTAAFLGLDYCRFLCQGYELSVRVRKAGSSSMTAPKYPRLLTVAEDVVLFSIYRVPSYRNKFRFIWRREKAKEKLQGEGSLPCVSVVR